MLESETALPCAGIPTCSGWSNISLAEPNQTHGRALPITSGWPRVPEALFEKTIGIGNRTSASHFMSEKPEAWNFGMVLKGKGLPSPHVPVLFATVSVQV